MSIATGIVNTTVEVHDQDRALSFYRDLLGCEVRTDTEVWPGARVLEVVPPGSAVAVALLTRESGLPIGVRYLTPDAESTHRQLKEAGFEPHTDVLYTDFAPPMFTADDPDGNMVIFMEEAPTPGGDDDGLAVTTVLAALPVRDHAAAVDFYSRLFGRAADAEPMPGLAQWLCAGAGVQVVEDADHAGGGLATLQVADLDLAAEQLHARGIEIETASGTQVTAFATLTDPDGNTVTLVPA